MEELKIIEKLLNDHPNITAIDLSYELINERICLRIKIEINN